MLDIAQMLNIVSDQWTNSRAHARNGGDKRRRRRLPGMLTANPAGIGAGGFHVGYSSSMKSRSALKLIQHASRIEQNLPQRKVIRRAQNNSNPLYRAIVNFIHDCLYP